MEGVVCNTIDGARTIRNHAIKQQTPSQKSENETMSLFPISESNPDVAKVSKLLAQSIEKIAAPSPGTVPVMAEIQEASGMVHEAIALLKGPGMPGIINIPNALKEAKQGAEMLDRVLATPMSGYPPMPRTRIPEMDRMSLDSAINSFNLAIEKLNAYHP